MMSWWRALSSRRMNASRSAARRCWINIVSRYFIKTNDVVYFFGKGVSKMSSGRRHRSRRASVGSLLLLPLLSTPAWAQTDAATSPADDASSLATVPVAQAAPADATPQRNDDNGSVMMQEVIVTARKREEPLQDVPVSISAFTADQLDARGIVNIRDLGTSVPGLQFTDLAGYNLIYLRGVGTDAFIPSADPSVATYLDGVYFPSAHSIAQSFGAVERIEVLKGPQGTLFGRNSTGGAVSIITKTPGPDAETSIQTSYGRFDDSKTRVYTNIPITETLAASVSGFYNRADNYYKLDNGTDDHLPSEIGKGARLKIGFKPTDNFSIMLAGMVMQQSGTSTTESVNTHPSQILGATIPAETRNYVVTADSEPSLRTRTSAYYGTAIWQLPWLDVKLLGSHYYVNADNYVYDFDGSSEPIATYGANSDFQRITTGELQFTSNAGSPGASWLKWVGGIYYLNSRGGYDPGYLTLTNVGLPTGSLLSGIVDTLPDGAVKNLLDKIPALDALRFNFTGLIGAESWSGYTQATASITDWFDVTLGGRYQTEKRTLIRSDVGLDNLGGGLTTLISFAPRDSTVDNFSPKVSLDFRPMDGLLLYTSYQQGFKSATYNIINIYTPPDYVKPEKVTSYEVGVKSDWFDKRLRVNGAVFQNNIKNLQTGFVSFTTGGAINFENAGSARIRGAETDIIIAPFHEWDPGFAVTLGGSWLHAIYTDYTGGSGYSETTGIAFTNGDFTGNRIVRTPKFSGSAGISQNLPVPGGQLEVAGSYYYNSGYYYLAQNSPVSYEGHYSVIGAHISYLYARWGLKVTLFGDNLGNERYDIAQFHTDFGREDTLAPPVTYGVRLNLDF
jgi:iron complex outermembrane receptor protein